MLHASRGGVYKDQYNSTTFGFKPIVCLKSTVQLKANSDGTYSIIDS